MSFEVYLSVCLHPCAFSCMCRLWSTWHPLMEIQGGIRDDTGNRIETNTLICNREENADDWAIWPASSWGSERRDAESEERKRFLPIPVSSALLMSWMYKLLHVYWKILDILLLCLPVCSFQMGFVYCFKKLIECIIVTWCCISSENAKIWLPLWTWMTLKSSLKKQFL